jgi:hypothetical protein
MNRQNTTTQQSKMVYVKKEWVRKTADMKAYNKAMYIAGKQKKAVEEAEELERINFGVSQWLKSTQLLVDLWEEDEDVARLNEMNREVHRAEMEYAHKTGDYGKIRGIAFENNE